jgi:hypothetical protein
MSANQLLPRETIQVAFTVLGDRVRTALRTQIGDVARLHEHRNECLRLQASAQQVRVVIWLCAIQADVAIQHAAILSSEDLSTINTSLQSMIDHLDRAAVASADPPDGVTIETTFITHTGRPGRPRIDIDHDILSTALQMRGPTALAPVFGASSRTVRRRALEYGLVEPGPPVRTESVADDGSSHLHHTSSTAPVSDLSDDAIDSIVRQIIQTFPTFGRRMIAGHVAYLGYRVPQAHLRASYLRVHGRSLQSFGSRRIERSVYSVPGPNSLWHHDGQHGTYL